MASSEEVSIVEPVGAEGEDDGSGTKRTFVRVKRRLRDEPPSTLILSFKRQRLDGEEEKDGENSEKFEVVNNVLRFAGSIQPNQTLGAFVKGLDTSTLKSDDEKTTENFKLKSLPPSNSVRRQRMQEEKKKKSRSGRYKIVNTKRGLDVENDVPSEREDGEAYLYSMFDLVEDETHGKPESGKSATDGEDVITCNGVPMVQTKSPVEKSQSSSVLDYVYDVYTIENPFNFEGQAYDVEHLWDRPIVYDQEESEDEKYDDESDSNDENNPDNDYPDEVSDASDGEKYYGYGDDDLYNWSEDEEVYGDADDGGGGSTAMKELDRHMHRVRLGERTDSESSN